MKTSTERILTTHVGSIPRPESVRALLRARLGGQAIDEAELAARAAEAVTEVVRRQAEVGLDIVSDGEISKTSFLAYTDERLTGFVPAAANDPSAAPTSAGGPWARRVDSRRWRTRRRPRSGNRRRLRLRPGGSVPAPAPHCDVGQVRGARPGSAARLRPPVGVRAAATSQTRAGDHGA